MNWQEYLKGKKVTILGLGTSETHGFSTASPAFLHGKTVVFPIPFTSRPLLFFSKISL
jgi:hypothetical protein